MMRILTLGRSAVRLATGRFTGAALCRGAVVTVLLAAAVCLAGCGGDGTNPAEFSGAWDGSLSLAYAGGGGGSGALELNLGQDEDFIAGWATWAAIRERQSVTGPIDGDNVALWLHFRCQDPEFKIPRTVIAVIAGELKGNTLTFSGASGLACTLGGAPVEVTGGAGQVVRRTDGQPL
jgi:hypothetical protein